MIKQIGQNYFNSMGYVTQILTTLNLDSSGFLVNTKYGLSPRG